MSHYIKKKGGRKNHSCTCVIPGVPGHLGYNVLYIVPYMYIAFTVKARTTSTPGDSQEMSRLRLDSNLWHALYNVHVTHTTHTGMGRCFTTWATASSPAGQAKSTHIQCTVLLCLISMTELTYSTCSVHILYMYIVHVRVYVHPVSSLSCSGGPVSVKTSSFSCQDKRRMQFKTS